MEQGTPREPYANIDSTRSCSLSLCSPPCWVQLPVLLFCVPGILAVLASLNAVLCFLTSGRVLSSGWVPSSCTTAWKASSGSSVQFISVTQSCLTLCDPMNRNWPGFSVHHQLPESTQTHVHRVGDAIQPSQPLSSPSPPALNLSQHQGLFK